MIGFTDPSFTETPRPVISGKCLVCKVTDEDVRKGYVVVSPQGTAHHAVEWGETHCGKDATPDGWWWPL